MSGPWTGDARYRLAPALLTLLHQLERAFPGQQWLTSPQTGTIGDAAHFAEGSASDHNPWLSDTVRALDVAANVTGVAGIATVTDGPDCEALFAMVNRMYAAKDPRVYPDGYGIYLRRVTDWNNPGGYHAQVGDPHLYHLHISVSRNPAGFNSTAPWPLPGESTDSGGATKIGDDMSAAEVADLKAYIDRSAAAVVAAIKLDLDGTKNRIRAFEPEIIGSSQREHDNTVALAGQVNTLHAAEIDAIKAAQPSTGPIDATAVEAAAEAGAAKALDGATATVTIHPGGTSS